ncbi:hypothetical protein SeLEV6574_g04222 [Synchytrium endobioticum]|uniref:AP2/ERF domain-containing protein n=1 Tax=Synchytrium endobioticum TaxID=286115 RepID=A0A507D124_9FUNG|nr:hypothetical protein SeLEV6574_g04222 [Synchytrium endobioticum]
MTVEDDVKDFGVLETRLRSRVRMLWQFDQVHARLKARLNHMQSTMKLFQEAETDRERTSSNGTSHAGVVAAVDAAVEEEELESGFVPLVDHGGSPVSDGCGHSGTVPAASLPLPPPLSQSQSQSQSASSRTKKPASARSGVKQSETVNKSNAGPPQSIQKPAINGSLKKASKVKRKHSEDELESIDDECVGPQGNPSHNPQEIDAHDAMHDDVSVVAAVSTRNRISPPGTSNGPDGPRNGTRAGSGRSTPSSSVKGRSTSVSSSSMSHECGPSSIGTKPTHYIGVYEGTDGLFHVHIKLNGREECVGSYATARDAALNYNREAIQILGDRAKLNKF